MVCLNEHNGGSRKRYPEDNNNYDKQTGQDYLYHRNPPKQSPMERTSPDQTTAPVTFMAIYSR